MKRAVRAGSLAGPSLAGQRVKWKGGHGGRPYSRLHQSSVKSVVRTGETFPAESRALTSNR